jgi:phospholipid/cholesterol/gamma-HCH transport system permease protein
VTSHHHDPLHHVDHHPTHLYPVVQRTGIRFFRQVSRSVVSFVSGVGQRGYFARDFFRALAEPRTWGPELIKQMRTIGVDSLPLAAIVAAFIGSVIALQTRYQLFQGIQLSVVGFIVRQSIVLELAPLLTGLVLTGRVGARMTAEIGTMRVTEQIDALETLAYDPIAYLVVPRVIAALVMLPVLTVFANAVALFSGMVTAVLATDVTISAFREGLKLGFTDFQVFYSLFKATLFGGAIAFLCSFEGYVADTGAEGVGRSTARAVVVTSVAILLLDSITAQLLARYLTG